MKFRILVVCAIAVLVVWSDALSVRASRGTPPDSPSVRVLAQEPGVVPAGTSFVVRTDDRIKTDVGSADVIYDAQLDQDILDQDGQVMIRKGSIVQLLVFRLGFLGPGGAGMTELAVGARNVFVEGVNYPIQTVQPQRNGGLTGGIHGAEFVGGAAEKDRIVTRGRHIDVPTGALLKLQTNEPIRLKGYSR